MDCFACARNDDVEAFVYPTGKSTRLALNRLSSPSRKNIRIFRISESIYIYRHPVPTRGALRGRHGRWVRDAVDADSAFDEWRDSGRRSRVVLTPRRWCQVLEKQASQGRRWQKSPVTGESTK